MDRFTHDMNDFLFLLRSLVDFTARLGYMAIGKRSVAYASQRRRSRGMTLLLCTSIVDRRLDTR